MLIARHHARRIPFSDRALLARVSAAPFQWLGVLGGIHWEALKLMIKRIRLRPRPAPPAQPVTFVPPAASLPETLP
jgi:DUF1365 family protein